MKREIYMSMLVFLLSSCVSEQENAWEHAKNENSIPAYESFVEEYPKSTYVDSAEGRIESIEWENAKSANTISAYESFVRQYSKSEYADSAGTNIEHINWLVASQDTEKVTVDCHGTVVIPYGRTKLLTIFSPVVENKKVTMSYKQENAVEEEPVLIANFTEANIACGTRSFYYKNSGYRMSDRTVECILIQRSPLRVSGRAKVRLFFVSKEDVRQDDEITAVSNVITVYVDY